MLVKPLVRSIVRSIAGVPTNSLGSGFNPTSLFADGSKGVVYDNNDLSSFYLDSAGVTPATVNGLVGLQLDKSAGLALASSSELVTNGTFPTDTSGWTLSSGTASVTQGAGGMTVFASVTAYVTQAITTVVGKNYRYSVEITANNAAAFLGIRKADDALATTNLVDLRTISNGVSVGWFKATATTTYIIVQANTGASITVDNISLTEWYAGNHRYQTTTGSKPVLRGTPTGANLVTNGDFAGGTTTGWTGNSATLSVVSGKIRVTTTGAGFCSGYQVISGLTPSGWYRLRGTCQKISGASVAYMRFYDTTPTTTPVAGPFFSSTSALVSGDAYFQASADGTITLNLSIESSAGAGETADFDDITLHDVSAGQVTAPYGLQYDGVDDFLQTAAVDFTATDKMFVCAGVRKLSDATEAILVEHTANVFANNGGFAIEAPRTGGVANYGVFSRGSVIQGANVTTYAAPITNVVSGVLDISGDSVLVRVNGAQVGSTSADQGTGNYANAVMYFGRRAGTANPYNGLDFGLVICGKTLTSTQISSTERYIAQRTGISI